MSRELHRALLLCAEVAMRLAGTRLVVVIGCGLVVGEYFGVYWASKSVSVQSQACHPMTASGGYSGAFAGWDSGRCLTQEQVWCQSNGAIRHPDCLTADCRAEEIRLSLVRNDPKPKRAAVYSGCLETERLLAYYDLVAEMNFNVTWGVCAACVPLTDKRSDFLPQCDGSAAQCRGFWFRSDNGDVVPRNTTCP